jgi:hypothetical protein
MRRVRDIPREDEALDRVRAAVERLSRCPRGSNVEEALDALQNAVDDARHTGLNWGPIADVVGMRRGAAYDRFARRRRFPPRRPA